eukprot:705886_1
MATTLHRCLCFASKATHLHTSVIRTVSRNHHRRNYYRHHRRYVQLNVFKSRLYIHYPFMRHWKKCTLLISLSAVGVTIANTSKSNVSATPRSKKSDHETIVDEKALDDEEEEKRLEEEALQHLIETITVKDHYWFVWSWLYLKRFTFLVFNFTPVILLAPFAYFNIFGIQSYWLQLLHDSIASGGSTFIKLGQWVSMRSDIFPIEICDHLSELRMRAPSHTFEDTCEVIKEAFGKDIDEIFDRFYIEPTASGSIAQVHKAQICINSLESANHFDDDMYQGSRTLLDWVWNSIITRKEIKEKKIAKPQYLDVAVKVRHPNILQNMYIDISIMYMLSNFVSSLPGLKGLKFPIHQKSFTQYLESQIDLSYEGKSLQKMYKNFERYNKHKKESNNVIFPKVIEELSNSAVLVETWECGVPLCNLDLSKLTDKCRHSIARECYDIFMKMALRDNFVHGDCHSGNILIRARDVTEGREQERTVVSILKDKTDRLSSTISENTNIPLPLLSKQDSKEKGAIKREIEGPLIFLDAGLTASLTKEGHKRFGLMMGHIATARCREAAELFGSWAIMDEHKDPRCFDKQKRFVRELEFIIDDSLRWRYKDSEGTIIPGKGVPFISIGPLLRNVLILTQQEHIVLDSSFSAVIASLGIIEGLIKTLDPSADFLQWGVPYLVKYRKLDSLRSLLN